MNVTKEMFEKMIIRHPYKRRPFRRIEERYVDISPLPRVIDDLISFLESKNIPVQCVFADNTYEQEAINDEVFESMRKNFPTGAAFFTRYFTPNHGLVKEFRSFCLLEGLGSGVAAVGYPYAYEDVWAVRVGALPDEFKDLHNFDTGAIGMGAMYINNMEFLEEIRKAHTLFFRMVKGWVKIASYQIDGIPVQYRFEEFFDDMRTTRYRLMIDRDLPEDEVERLSQHLLQYHEQAQWQRK